MKNIKYTICVFFVMLISLPAVAQKETYNWFFGNRSGLTFLGTEEVTTNTTWGEKKGLPKRIPSSQAIPKSIYEGCFSISDKDGNFLFASDGLDVYNKKMEVMKNGNGLLGHPSSTQSGIMAPKPEDPNRYYVITVPAIGGPGEPGLVGNGEGMQYSEINLDTPDGLGEVLAANKKTKLFITPAEITNSNPSFPANYTQEEVAENIAIVGHYNGVDYWMISKILKHYYVWKITKDGFSKPITYSDAFKSSVQGVIKFSPDGKLVAHISHGQGAVVYADFDTKTGIISNTGFKQLAPASDTFYLYSLEFSIDGKYLYLAAANPGQASSADGLFRMSMEEIKNPLVTEPTRLLPSMTNVQLGPNGYIYGISQYSPHLWVVLDPEDGGKMIHQMVNFFEASYAPRLGLPTFITSFFAHGDLQTTPSDICLGEEAELSIQLTRGSGASQIAKIAWDFGDGTPAVETNDWTSNIHKVKHVYKRAGIYSITITPYYGTSNPNPNSPAEDKKAVVKILVGACSLPVNHNITNMGYSNH